MYLSTTEIPQDIDTNDAELNADALHSARDTIAMLEAEVLRLRALLQEREVVTPNVCGESDYDC